MPVLLDKVKGLFKNNVNAGHTVGVVQKRLLAQYVTQNKDPGLLWDYVGDLGDGAFGKVRKARHKFDNDKLAAAKTIDLSEEERLEDFLTEIEILSECRHKNVVGLHEAYFYQNSLFLYLEFCGGGALDSLMIELEKPLSEAQIKYVCHELCEALAFLHDKLVIHRDLKAGNVLLTTDGQVKLADFGVSAKNKSATQKRDTFIGTPFWMAPEVMICETFKDCPYDYKADIWSLGVTLIELAQMEPPNHEMSAMRVLIKIQKSDPPKLSNPHKWSHDFSDFLTKCLIKSPSSRWPARDLVSHSFCRNCTNPKPILALLSEAGADVIDEQIEELEDDNSMASVSSPENGELSTDGTDVTDCSVRNLTVNNEPNQISSAPNSTKTNDSGVYMDSECNTTSIQCNSDTSRITVDDQKASQISIGEQKRHAKQLDDSANICEQSQLSEIGNENHVRNESEYSLGGDSVCQMADEILNNLYDSLTTEEGTKKFFNQSSAFVEPATKREQNISRILISVPENSSEEENRVKASAPAKTDTNRSNNVYFKKISINFNEAKTDDLSASANFVRPQLPVDKNAAAPKQRPISLKTSSTNADKPPTGQTTVILRSLDALKEESSSLSYSSSRSGSLRSNEIAAVAESCVNRKSVHDMKAEFEKASSGASVGAAPPPLSGDRRSVAAAAGVSSPSQQFKQRASVLEQLLNNSQASTAPTLHVIAENRRVGVAASPTPSRRRDVTVDVASSSSTVGVKAVTPSFENARRSIDAAAVVGGAVPSTSRTIDLEGKRPSTSGTHAGANAASCKKTAAPPPPPPPEPPIDYDDDRTRLENQAIRGSASDEHSPSIVVPFRSPKLPKILSSPVAHRQIPSGPISNSSSVINGSLSTSQNSRSNDPRVIGANGLGSRRQYIRRTVTKKTRAYVVDGVPVTSTTYHIMADDGTKNYKAKEDFNLRKSELQALRRLQKEEARQFQELACKTEIFRESQERKFIQDMQNIQNQYDSDLELMTRYHKKQLEETERIQEEEYRSFIRKLKSEQDRDLRLFRDGLKQEQKLLKHEVELVPKSDRKQVYRTRRELMEVEHLERDRQFIEKQQQAYEAALSHVQESNKRKVAALERQFLEQKHQLLRAREASLWEMEERQLHEKNQIAKSQLKDIFLLQRSQMLLRHQKEIDHMKKLHMNKEEEYNRVIVAEMKRLPKSLRSDSKIRLSSFKELLKSRNLDPLEISRQMREFDEREQKRLMHELKKQELKLKKRLEHIKIENEAARKELEIMQNEKRKMLMEHENERLKKLEEEYSGEIKAWRSQLKSRRQALEDKFAKDFIEQENFYKIFAKEDESQKSVVVRTGSS